MYKMIACDLDETLLSSDRKVSEKNRRAIEKAKEKGVKFVLATGRGFLTVQNTLDEINQRDLEKEYVISFNGGAITENKGNRLLYFEGISFESASALYERGRALDVCIHVYTKDTVYVYGMSPDEKDYIHGRMEVVEISEDNLEFLRGEDIVKMLYMNTDAGYLKKIEEALKDITKDMDVSYSSNRYIEFNKKGVTKGAGLLKLAEMLRIDPKDTIAIGDNYNDLSMIRAAGLGVGVANTVESMKKECDFITEATNEQGAIAEVIEKFIL